MNKAFIREPEFDGRAYCPRCGSLGVSVGEAVLDRHVQPPSRSRLGDSAWFCGFAKCDVAYFDLLERVVEVAELREAVYPKDPSAPICACFQFTRDEIEADLRDGSPRRVRELLAKSKSSEAHCAALAADGQCCMAEVQRLYMRGLAQAGEATDR
jgi:hypothetical protein